MATRRPMPKIQATKNYSLFILSSDNRPLDMRGHRYLGESMKRYGFHEAFPIAVYRDEKKRLVVKDGQHRFAFARELGLPVYYVITTQDFDVSIVNRGGTGWKIKDFAMNFADKGKKDYEEVLSFSSTYQLPLTVSAALLAGVTSFTVIKGMFVSGTFVVVDRAWANTVASVYFELIRLDKSIKSQRLCEACMAVCRVDGFQRTRLIQNANRCRDRLAPYSTREAYLDMLEEIYNFGRHRLVGLKAAALMVMRERNPAVNGKEKARRASALARARARARA